MKCESDAEEDEASLSTSFRRKIPLNDFCLPAAATRPCERVTRSLARPERAERRPRIEDRAQDAEKLEVFPRATFNPFYFCILS